MSKLRRRCLICDHSFGMLRFHDTVFLCLMKWPDNADQRALENSFLGFFAERIDVADYHFQRALHTCSAKVAELRRARPLGPDLAHYLYLLLDLPEKDAQVVEALARESLGGHIANRTALECGFQARELCRRLGMAAEEAERLDQATVTQVASLAGTDMPDLTRHTLLHHQGKAYRRLGEEDSARNAFAMALKVFPAAPHTRLQLSRLTAGAEQAEHLRRILGDFEKDPGAVAITVALAAVEETARLKDIAAVMPTADFLGVAVDAICLAQGEGYGQPFVTLAAIARARWYDDSPRLARIASILSLPPPEALDPKTAFGVAEAMKNVAKALLDSGDEQKGHRWLALAEPYYAKVDVTRAFAATMVAEYWVLRREGQRALGSLQQAGDCRGNAFYHYRRAQALLLIDETAGALAEIALALENAEPKYRSAFLGCQADILSRAGDRAGVKRCLEEALTCCENSKFRDAIQGRISRLLPVEPGTVGSEAIPRGGGDLSSTP